MECYKIEMQQIFRVRKIYCAIYKTYKGSFSIRVPRNGSNFKSDDSILLKQRFADYNRKLRLRLTVHVR